MSVNKCIKRNESNANSNKCKNKCKQKLATVST